MQPIFIGGTGRSGTTILAKILSQHNNVYKFPIELRYLTDPDGLLSLKTALTVNWSFYQADFAVERFFKLMKQFSRRTFGAYPHYNIPRLTSNEFYDNWIN